MTSLGLTANLQGNRAWWPPGASFAIDFTTRQAMRNGVALPLWEAMSFTRASMRLARTSAGRWQTFGVNEPAITDLGLSVEPARTNLVLANTADSGPGLILTDVTRTALAAGDSPALDNHGKRIVQGGGSTAAFYFGSFAGLISAGSVHTISACFKYDGGARFLRFLISDNVSVVRQTWIDLVDKTVGNVTAGSTATLTPLIDGWVHVALTTTPFPNTTGGGQFGVVAVEAMGNAIRTTGSYKIWGGQLEIDTNNSTSPILTYGTGSSRSSDMVALLMPPGQQSLVLHMQDGTTRSAQTIGEGYSIPNDLRVSIMRCVSAAL